jgi:hypothetical protein
MPVVVAQPLRVSVTTISVTTSVISSEDSHRGGFRQLESHTNTLCILDLPTLEERSECPE